jgi:hypothetical protein
MNRYITPMNRTLTFLQEGVIVGFQNFACGFKSQNNKIWGKTKFWGLHLPRFFFFFRKNEKFLESPEMVRKLIGKFVKFFDNPHSRQLHQKNSAIVDGGAERRF